MTGIVKESAVTLSCYPRVQSTEIKNVKKNDGGSKPAALERAGHVIALGPNSEMC